MLAAPCDDDRSYLVLSDIRHSHDAPETPVSLAELPTRKRKQFADVVGVTAFQHHIPDASVDRRYHTAILFVIPPLNFRLSIFVKNVSLQPMCLRSWVTLAVVMRCFNTVSVRSCILFVFAPLELPSQAPLPTPHSCRPPPRALFV